MRQQLKNKRDAEDCAGSTGRTSCLDPPFHTHILRSTKFIWNWPYNRQAGYDYQKFVYRHRFKGHRNSLTTDYWKSIENQLDAWCFWPFAVSWGNGCWRRIHHGRWKYKIQSQAGHLVKNAKNFTSSFFSIYIKVLAFHLFCLRDRFFDGYCENSYRQSISCRQDRHPQSN